MNQRLPIRPCAEFPCDNPSLSVRCAPSAEAPSDENTSGLDGGDGFDWGAIDHWVAETKRRWAQHDAPDVCFPVLSDAALECTGSAAVQVEPKAEVVATVDPFIDELMSFITLESPAAVSVPEFDESGEIRTVPRAVEVQPRHQVSDTLAQPTDLIMVQQPAQPLLPLHLELTPTPAIAGPWTQLTHVLGRYLLQSGYTRAAALLPALLNGELVDVSRLPADAIERLTSDSVVETRAGRAVTTRTFREAAKAFREAFGDGGLHTDDALFWLSQLLTALSGGAVDEATLDEQLRELGVHTLLEYAA